MDSLIAASARALAAGDALGALKRVALRDDPPALALRGIAMAQLGEHPRARELLRRAARGFGAHEELARARCVVAEAEVALAMRDLGGSPRPLAAAASTLEARADRANALQARLIAVRRLVLLGRLDEAAAALARLDARGLPPALAAVARLTEAELALRSLRTASARAALALAQEAADRAGVPALLAELAELRAVLDRPAARRLFAGAEQALCLDEVAALLASDALVVDACRRGLGAGDAWRPLARRPVLFALARALAEAWPGDVDREALIANAFNTRRPDETHRARLRVEIGRLRALVKPLAHIEATARGFVLKPHGDRAVVVLAPPIDGEQASLVALLSDGAAWSTSALALALGASQRTVQRALVELEAAGRVRAIGQARARRWLSPPLAGFTTILLLPAALPFA
ncbi:helix-turn-helix domain-containing protein [Variovorax sp. J22G21]|uniref:helix-turn-helix domain-containing protein n=1 Tax=Variovorax fucosicus TaxID=3053517 RepID=UPI002578A484|nr:MULTISPECIES: helix-turn-helix domain-containing protein [unclassified Variovorax]MDM0038952.1 helix-turn-helix domain-containing protein [Variovorax sp. J22R193]MDM0063728.1 helix-turn-helix domain-containing protein [Variovorax sp. J22G21]